MRRRLHFRAEYLVKRGLVEQAHGRIVEDAPTQAFFGAPRAKRAQQFLAKILHH